MLGGRGGCSPWERCPPRRPVPRGRRARPRSGSRLGGVAHRPPAARRSPRDRSPRRRPALGTRVAGSADAYGYVSQARLWARGDLPVVQLSRRRGRARGPRRLDVSRRWVPARARPAIIVPTYPPGLPLVMAAAPASAGTDAVFLGRPDARAVTVWLTFLARVPVRGRRQRAAMAAVLLVAAARVPLPDRPADERRAGDRVVAPRALGAAAGRPFAAGLGAGAAVLTRPTLAPSPVVAAVMAHAHRRSLTPRAVLHAAIVCALPVAAAAGFLAWLNTRLYGSPLASGYGAASDLFALANVPVNSGRYLRWLLETQTPFVLLAAAPFAARIRRPASPGASDRTGLVRTRVRRAGARVLPALLAVAGSGVLPGFSPGHSGGCSLLASAPLSGWRRRRRPACACRWSRPASGSSCGSTSPRSGRRSAFDSDRLESRYVAAGAFASRTLPERAVLLSVQESGPLRMVRRSNDAAVRLPRAEKPRRGREVPRPRGLPALLRPRSVEGGSVRRARFAASSPLGLLDWPPRAEVGRPVRVRFYDPRD